MIYSLFGISPLLRRLAYILWPMYLPDKVHTRKYLFVELSSPISSAASLKHQ